MGEKDGSTVMREDKYRECDRDKGKAAGMTKNKRGQGKSRKCWMRQGMDNNHLIHKVNTERWSCRKVNVEKEETKQI